MALYITSYSYTITQLKGVVHFKMKMSLDDLLTLKSS